MISTWTPTQGHAGSRSSPWPPRQLVSWAQTCCGFFGSALSLRWAGPAGRSGPPGEAHPPVQDAAAEVQDLVNRLGSLSGAAGVYLVPRLPGPVPAPMGSGSSSALPGGLVMVDGGGPAAHSVGGP